MSHLFEQLLKQKHTLLADGATGTSLFALGLQSGHAPELWNVDEPERISRHYRSFIRAGSDIVLTNTFGGTGYRLKLHQAQDRVTELNVAAVALLKAEIQASGREIVIAGSMGPTGEILAPLGALQPKAAVAAFTEQALALKAGGADVLWIETMSARDEVELAIQGAQVAGLPVVFSMSFDTNGRTMMGVGAADLMRLYETLDSSVYACGSNCGTGAAEVVATVLNLRSASAAGSHPVIIAKANCGIPEFVDGQIVYNGTPEIMARYAVMARDAGARIIGGCCGTTAAHIACMREALDSTPPQPAPSMQDIERVLGPVTEGAWSQARGEHHIPVKSSGRKRRRLSGHSGGD